MSDKIRVGGETIDPRSDKKYSSREVRCLVNAAFENGKRAGNKESYESMESRYKDGYVKGYVDGSQDLQDFKDVMLRILGKEREQVMDDLINRLTTLELAMKLQER